MSAEAEDVQPQPASSSSTAAAMLAATFASGVAEAASPAPSSEGPDWSQLTENDIGEIISGLRAAVDENINAFTQKPLRSNKFLPVLMRIRDLLDTIEARAYVVAEVAPLHDPDPSFPYNGFRSMLKALIRCLKHLRDALVVCSQQREALFFRADMVFDQLDDYGVRMLSVFSTLFAVLGRLHQLLPPGQRFYSLEKDPDAAELLRVGHALDISCFFGQRVGFQFTLEMQRVFRIVLLGMAGFSDAYHSTSKSNITRGMLSAWAALKYAMHPEEQAQKLVALLRSKSAPFVKSFFNLTETTVAKNFSRLTMPRVQVNRVFYIAPFCLMHHTPQGVLPLWPDVLGSLGSLRREAGLDDSSPISVEFALTARTAVARLQHAESLGELRRMANEQVVLCESSVSLASDLERRALRRLLAQAYANTRRRLALSERVRHSASVSDAPASATQTNSSSTVPAVPPTAGQLGESQEASHKTEAKTASPTTPAVFQFSPSADSHPSQAIESQSPKEQQQRDAASTLHEVADRAAAAKEVPCAAAEPMEEKAKEKLDAVMGQTESPEQLQVEAVEWSAVDLQTPSSPAAKTSDQADEVTKGQEDAKAAGGGPSHSHHSHHHTAKEAIAAMADDGDAGEQHSAGDTSHHHHHPSRLGSIFRSRGHARHRAPSPHPGEERPSLQDMPEFGCIRVRLISKHRHLGQLLPQPRSKAQGPRFDADASALPPLDNLIIHVHGGGFIANSSESHIVYLAPWAHDITNAIIVSIDYSLAPEAPYPRASQEVFYAYVWCLEQAALLGSHAKRVVLVGDSAGGNLVVSAALRAVMEGARLPDAIFAFYPSLHVGLSLSASRFLSTFDPLLSQSVLETCLEAYVGKDRIGTGLAEDPLLSPICAPDDLLRGLPPVILVGLEMDPLLDDALAFAHRLHSVGTRFSMVVLKDAPHGFLNFKDASEETLRYYARCTSMINQALHGPVPYAEVPKAEWVTWHPN